MTNASLIVSNKQVRDDLSIIQIVIWLVPTPVPPCTHPFKYSLVLIRKRVRVAGMDNERGKGDHQHFGGVETPYGFSDIRSLLADFRRLVVRADVAAKLAAEKGIK